MNGGSALPSPPLRSCWESPLLLAEALCSAEGAGVWSAAAGLLPGSVPSGGDSWEGDGDTRRSPRGSAPRWARQRYGGSHVSQAIVSLWRVQFRVNLFSWWEKTVFW